MDGAGLRLKYKHPVFLTEWATAILVSYRKIISNIVLSRPFEKTGVDLADPIIEKANLKRPLKVRKLDTVTPYPV